MQAIERKSACRYNNTPPTPGLDVNAINSFRPLPMVEDDFPSMFAATGDNNEDADGKELAVDSDRGHCTIPSVTLFTASESQVLPRVSVSDSGLSTTAAAAGEDCQHSAAGRWSEPSEGCGTKTGADMLRVETSDEVDMVGVALGP